jgi:hypothetical protein
MLALMEAAVPGRDDLESQPGTASTVLAAPENASGTATLFKTKD